MHHVVPASLKSVDDTLSVFVGFGIGAIVLAVVLLFAIPAEHYVSMILGVSGGAAVGISLFLKVTLWLVAPIGYGLLILSAIALAYELYTKFKTGKFDVPGDGQGNL